MIYVVLIILVIFGIAIWGAQNYQRRQAKDLHHQVHAIRTSEDAQVQLKHLQDLRDAGTIDDEDYQQSKQRILNNQK